MPLPDSEPRIAGLHLPVAIGFLTLGALQLSIEGVSAATVLQAAIPIGLGGFVVLIVGTSRMLLSGTADLEVAGKRTWWLPLGALTLGTLGLWPVLPLPPRGRLIAGALWGLGLAGHVALVASTLAHGKAQAEVEQGWPPKLASVGAITYGLVSTVTVPLAAAGMTPWLPTLHLAFAGFVVLTIVAVAIEVLPRFTGLAFPAWLAWAIAAPTIIGPALLAWGMLGNSGVQRAGAIIEFAGLSLLAVGLLGTVSRSERERASFLLYGAGALSVLAGAAIGAGVVWGLIAWSWIPIHGVVNLLGFVGFIVLGATIDLYAPSLKPGAASHHRHNRLIVWLSVGGLAGFLVLQLLEVPWAVYGLVLYAGAAGLHTAGSVARLR